MKALSPLCTKIRYGPTHMVEFFVLPFVFMRGIPFQHQVIDMENILFYSLVEGILHFLLVYLEFIISLVH